MAAWIWMIDRIGEGLCGTGLINNLAASLGKRQFLSGGSSIIVTSWVEGI